ncbi:unnamed protein product [Linum tenue]|uniref:RNA polymerase Rpb7-like N-terminal domain-containing protein n=1 Tax=Linum tenue TaxID=586396 RepID=A0AAV0RJS2_9ROSI|nr:unnamed protein product [Linum tenue]CAI0460422.1 unnamed protein product [Linum tenue]CAI0556794.1 unnamed protein product [Linum tenue]
MFFLSLIEHKLRFPPADLSLPLHKGIKKFLDGIFLDRVILNLGRCVSIYDIRNIYGGFIHAGEGAPTYTYRVDSLMISMCQLISFPNHAIKFQILIADLKSDGYGNTTSKIHETQNSITSTAWIALLAPQTY